MAREHAEYRKKPATSMHTGLATYIKQTTGYDVDLESIKLGLLLAPVFRQSDANAARKRKLADEAAKAEQARIAAAAKRAQDAADRKQAVIDERKARLQAQLDALDGGAPAPRKATPAKKAAPAKAAQKVTPRRVSNVTPIKAAKAIDPTPTAARGELREQEDEGDVDPY